MHGGRREAGAWLDTADPLTQLLWRQHDVLTRAQAIAHMSQAALVHRVHSGRWVRFHRGVYVAHTGPLTHDQRLWAAVLSVGTHATLAGTTAAQRCGLTGCRERPATQIHILVPAASRDCNPPPGVTVHRTTLLSEVDVNRRGSPPHTTIARSIVDAAAWATSDDRAYELVAAAFQQRLLAGDEIDRTLDRMPRTHRRALIRQAAADARGGAHSLPEGLLVRGLRLDGLPVPILQVIRRTSAGNTYFLDGYFEEWKVHIEVDGYQHTDTQTYWEDMHRQNDLWIAGDRVLRFPSMAVRYDLPLVIAQIRSALISAGWRP